MPYSPLLAYTQDPRSPLRRDGDSDAIDFAATARLRGVPQRACAATGDRFDWAPRWAAARVPAEARCG